MSNNISKIRLLPRGFPCKLENCPPGLFLFDNSVCLKTEYRTDDGRIEAYCDSGEFFWGGTDNEKDKRKLIVQPLVVKIIYNRD